MEAGTRLIREGVVRLNPLSLYIFQTFIPFDFYKGIVFLRHLYQPKDAPIHEYNTSYMGIKRKGGEGTSSISPNNHSNRLIHVIYWDHLEFNNSSHKLYSKCNIREAVGWLILETDKYIVILYDRSVERQPNEHQESGLILIKSDIIELREIK